MKEITAINRLGRLARILPSEIALHTTQVGKEEAVPNYKSPKTSQTRETGTERSLNLLTSSS